MPPQEYGIIKEYNLKSINFKTVKIPKGTLLFRGIHYGSKSPTSAIFSDFIGYGKDGRIAPTMNVFFYPVPYLSDAVSAYNIHCMYITQYELELILLVKPAEIDRENAHHIDGPVVSCDRIAEHDACGFTLYDTDPCITDKVLRKYPYINGYIAISHQDSAMLLGKYKGFIRDGEYEKAKHIIPSILMNSGELVSIPEIAIHPFYNRYDGCYAYGTKLRRPDEFVDYCIRYRARFNYFPLLYITNTGKYTLTNITDNVLRKIEKTERLYNGNKMPKLYTTLERIVTALLHDGYRIDNVLYQARIDIRTGFYIITNKAQNGTRKIVKGSLGDFSSKNDVSKYIANTAQYFDTLIMGLNRMGYSLRTEYVFNKGSIPKYITKFHINEVIDRPELEEYRVRRLRDSNRTLKNIKERFIHTYPDIDASSVDSIS
jgi:hypothetical protein